MANPIPTMSAGAGGPQPSSDAQTLVTLLGSLMPLLMRIQSATAEQIAPIAGQGHMLQMLQGATAPDPMIDHQAAVNFVQDMVADSLRTLSSYVEANAERHAGLENGVALVTQAARCYAARDYGQAFALIWHAYRLVTALRQTDPQLPPLRSAGPAGAQFQAVTTMTH